MLATHLFKLIEQKVPLSLALKDDLVGFIGPGHPDEIEVEKVAVVLDVLPDNHLEKLGVDLLVCHHPPLFPTTIPTYVIHSNWDVVQGGANDALAESLKLDVLDVLEEETGIGRICETESCLDVLIETIFQSIPVDNVRVVAENNVTINKVAIVSGFGLNPKYIKLASDRGADLYLSGDLTHPGSILAQKLGIILLDATHQATEVPGLKRLCQLFNVFGITAQLQDPLKPWKNVTLNIKD